MRKYIKPILNIVECNSKNIIFDSTSIINGLINGGDNDDWNKGVYEPFFRRK